MKIVNLGEAKKSLSQLVDAAARGQSFVIARAGKPLVKVVSVETKPANLQRIGFLEGQVRVPEDFDRMYEDEIEEMFTKGD